MRVVVLAVTAAYGVHLLYTALLMGWRGVGAGDGRRRVPVRARAERRLREAGVDLRLRELAGAGAIAAVVAGSGAWALFGGLTAPIVAAAGGAATPAALARGRLAAQRSAAIEVWPALIEEVRLRATTLGRSLPQALFDAAPEEPPAMAVAFADARREWLLSTDFDRALAVLRDRLADPTADAVCETLLVAHEVGGADVDRVLRALADDRIADLQGRKDALSRQAGARFARSFTLVVPLGMALVGLSIGQGRTAYATASGQALVLVGLSLMAVCWVWAGHVLRLPPERRVFVGNVE